MRFVPVILVREEAKEYFKRDWVADNPDAVKAYLFGALALEEREHFSIIFLDNKHQLLKFEIMFSGTVDSAAVYPREVAKRALELNACAVILAHNHPSGNAEPSKADIEITENLKQALGLFKIRVLDHFVIGKESISMAERGLL